jgi:hypothetical protein
MFALGVVGTTLFVYFVSEIDVIHLLHVIVAFGQP